MKKYKDVILYGIISALIFTLLLIQNVIYVRVIDNAVIFGINIDKPEVLGVIEPYLPADLDAQLEQNVIALAEADELIKDARC